MKKIILSLLSVIAFTSLARASNYEHPMYDVAKRDSVMCANLADLEALMGLNMGKSKAAVRKLYQELESDGRLVCLQPGDEVQALDDVGEGIQYVDCAGRRGYIALADLDCYH
jgi:hypothetical protein